MSALVHVTTPSIAIVAVSCAIVASFLTVWLTRGKNRAVRQKDSMSWAVFINAGFLWSMVLFFALIKSAPEMKVPANMAGNFLMSTLPLVGWGLTVLALQGIDKARAALKARRVQDWSFGEDLVPEAA